MMYPTTFFAALISFMTPLTFDLRAQESSPDTQAQRLIHQFLAPPDQPRARVLLLGVFHFANPGLDSFRPEHEIDVTSEQRQLEIQEIVEKLAAFKPTIVAVERRPKYQSALDEEYAAFKKGEFALPTNEIYQLGFRLAAAANLDGVHCIDAPGRAYEPSIDLSQYARESRQARYLLDPILAKYTALYRHMDEHKMRTTLREHLLLTNAPALIAAQHGVYLQRSLAVGDGDEIFPGADGFPTQWFNRNLRIFGNLRRINQSPEDRIVVIFGAGHIAHLRQSVVSCQAFDLVEVAEVLQQ